MVHYEITVSNLRKVCEDGHTEFPPYEERVETVVRSGRKPLEAMLDQALAVASTSEEYTYGVIKAIDYEQIGHGDAELNVVEFDILHDGCRAKIKDMVTVKSYINYQQELHYDTRKGY